MEYQFTKGIQRANAAQLRLTLSSALHDSKATENQIGTKGKILNKENPKNSSTLAVTAKTTYSFLSSGSFYSQDSWVGPEAWASDKQPNLARPTDKPVAFAGGVASPSKLREPVMRKTNISNNDFNDRNTPSPALRNTPISSRTSNISRSILSSVSTSELSSATYSISSIITTSESNPRSATNEDAITTAEKQTRLKQMYKRASRSTKAFAKMFSRSSASKKKSSTGSGSTTIDGGITKRLSLKSPLPFPPSIVLSPPGREIQVLSESPALGSYYGFGLPPSAGTSSETSPFSSPSTGHKRTKSSATTVLELPPPDTQAILQRSPSVSSPLGIPTSPLLTRFMQQQQKQDNNAHVRGRDIPFPMDPSYSFASAPPSPSQRSTSRNASTTDIVPHQQNTPVVHTLLKPLEHSARTRARQTPPPEMPIPPLPPPVISVPPPPASGPVVVKQRPRSKSVTGAMHSNSLGELSRRIAPPPDISTLDQLAERSKHLGMVRSQAHEVRIVAPTPSMPSMRAAFLEMDSGKAAAEKEMAKPGRSRSGSVRGTGQPNLPGQQEPEIPAPEALPPSIIVGLSERRAQNRAAGSAKSSREPSPSRDLPRQQKLSSVPSLLTTTGINSAEEESTLQGKYPTSLRSTRSFRSPSFSSLRTHLTNAPPVPVPVPRANSHYEELSVRVGTAHVRSPSLPNFPSTMMGGQPDDAQPLPPSVTERVSSRTRSASKSGEQPPPPPAVNWSSKPHAPPIPQGVPSTKSALDTIHSGAASQFAVSTTTVPSLQIPPSPSVSRLLRTRVGVKKSDATNLRSPSMPDLRSASKSQPHHGVSGNQNERPGSRPRTRSPSPTRVQPAPAPAPVPVIVDVDQNPRSTSYRFLREKPNLTREKEHSYPPSNLSNLFQARSNKELAKEGGWDFLDAPPRPPRSPLPSLANQNQASHSVAQSQSQPQLTRIRSRSVSASTRVVMRPDGETIPPMPELAFNYRRKASREFAVGEAL